MRPFVRALLRGHGVWQRRLRRLVRRMPVAADVP
jgi:hypothetical protein